MRIRIVTITVIALVGITFLAGCSKDATNANGSNNATTNTTNAGATPSPSIAQPSPTATATVSAATPTEAFKSYYEAIKRKDINAFKSLLSKGTLAKLEERATRQSMTVDAAIKEGIEEANKEVPASLPPTQNEKIDGDKATLEINDEKKEKWVTLNFVREDGQWKISFDESESK